MPTDIKDLIQDLGSGEVALTCSVLQLIPENAEKLVRLQHVAALATQIQDTSQKPLSSTQVRRLLKHQDVDGERLRREEDQFDDVWIQSIDFFGGSYLMSVGQLSDSVKRLQTLLRAAFDDQVALPGSFRADVHVVATALLQISHASLKSAGLNRGDQAIPGRGDPILVPSTKRRGELAAALIYSRDALVARLTDTHLGNLLMRPDSSRSLFSQGPVDDAIILQPFLLRTSDIILLSPLDLASTLIAHISRLAHEHGCAVLLDQAVNHVLWRRTSRALSLMEASPEAAIEVRGKVQLRRYSTVETHRIVVCLIPPGIAHLQVDDPFGAPNYREPDSTIEELMRGEVEAWGGDERQLLFVVLQETLGAAAFIGFTHAAPRLVIGTNLADLEVLATIRHHPLTLFRFALALDHLKQLLTSSPSPRWILSQSTSIIETVSISATAR